jgi:hypothetical protein
MSFFVDMHFVLLLESMFFFLLLLFVSLLDFVLLLRIGMEFERFFFFSSCSCSWFSSSL